MKDIKLIVLLLFSSLVANAQMVVQVFDGDTYKVLDSGKFTIIPLANVDAPELNQYYGNTVKFKVARLILVRIVRLEVIDKDRYGRTVANISIDNMRLDSLLVANGWAWHYSAYSHNPSLSGTEETAIKLHAGMWKRKHNIPPRKWRKIRKTKTA